MMIPVRNINTVQGNILVQEERKYGNLLVRNAPGTISKGDQADGKWHRKRKENDQDTEKFREIPGYSGKFREDVIKFVCLFCFFPPNLPKKSSQKISPKEFLQKNSVKKNVPVQNAPGTISKGDQADGKWHRKRKENDQADGKWH